MRNGGVPMYRWLGSGLLVLAALAGASEKSAEQAVEQYRQIAQLAREDPDAARAELGRWQQRLEGAGDPDARAAWHRARALLYRREGRHDLAATELVQALALLEAVPDSVQRPMAQVELAVSHALSGLHADALPLFREAAERFARLGDWQRASAALANLGNSLDAGGDRAAARKVYAEALAMKREHGIARGQSSLLNNLADLDESEGLLPAAAARLQEAVELARQDEDEDSQALALANLVRVLARQERFQEAEAMLAELDRLAASRQPRRLAARHESAALLHRARAEAATDPHERERQWQAALAMVERALAVAEHFDEPERKARLLHLAGELEAALGRPQKAVQRLLAAEAVQAALERRRQGERLAQLAARDQALQRSRELAAAQRLAQQQRWMLAGALLALGLAVAVGFGLWRWGRQRRLRAAELAALTGALGKALDHAEAERQRAEALAAQQGQLLQQVGLELRDPLLRIRGSAERLMVQAAVDAGLRLELGRIAQDAARLVHAAEQMAESAARQALAARPAAVEAGALVRAVLAELERCRPAPAGGCTLESPATPVLAAVDGERLQLVLLELLQYPTAAGPGRPRRIRVEGTADGARVWLEDPGGKLWAMLDPQQAPATAAPGGRLGPFWIRRTLEALGVRLGRSAAGAALHPALVLELPAGAVGDGAGDPPGQAEQGSAGEEGKP
ncbi:MAG: hypothetical protein KatS3mg126_2492 [Lysobacteraceae bacterium]|nr:MAG: hypothetical protein KatS3mg126_2492 [Xanthomonadaceae bacterium]